MLSGEWVPGMRPCHKHMLGAFFLPSWDQRRSTTIVDGGGADLYIAIVFSVRLDQMQLWTKGTDIHLQSAVARAIQYFLPNFE